MQYPSPVLVSPEPAGQTESGRGFPSRPKMVTVRGVGTGGFDGGGSGWFHATEPAFRKTAQVGRQPEKTPSFGRLFLVAVGSLITDCKWVRLPHGLLTHKTFGRRCRWEHACLGSRRFSVRPRGARLKATTHDGSRGLVAQAALIRPRRCVRFAGLPLSNEMQKEPTEK